MQDHLNRLAEALLRQLNDGLVDFGGTVKFGGVSRETARWSFQGRIEDLESPAEVQDELRRTLPSVPAERRNALAAKPEDASDLELSDWLEASGVFDQVFELGYLFPLSQDMAGPCAIISTTGDLPQPDLQIFVVAKSRSDAESQWNSERLGSMMLFTRRQ